MRRLMLLPILPICLGFTGCITVSDASPSADNYTYNDAWKPHGHARGAAAEAASAKKCDGGDTGRIGTPAFNACMKTRGWRLAASVSTPQQDSASNDSFTVTADPGPQGPDPTATETQEMTQSEMQSEQQNDAATAATQQTEYNFNVMYNQQPN